ncbi:MAG TPA: pyridoxal phosphate-dependent aminotransferase [candidate division Zixibacteria bacterium]|nr:pyridoxal phosphate-dependent aminotransferase [candidate division Zixibacteria bacterium]
MKYSILSDKLSNSPTLAISAKAKKLASEGLDVISFSAGQPDFETPAPAKAAGIEAIENNITGYTASSGTPRLRELVARWMSREIGVEYKPNQVIVSSGAKFAIAASILATVEAGDEVIFTAPYWVSYPDMVKLSGAEPVIVETHREEGFKLTPDALESAITPKTRMVLLNSPSNPTGAVYSEAEIRALADVLAKYPEIWILSDEIYSRLVFDGKPHVSIAAVSPELAERTIVVNGVSKAFAMTGWRIGWAAGPAELIARAGKIQSHTTSCPSSISQHAAEKALTADDSFMEDWCAQYERRRDLFAKLLETIPGIEPFIPDGAFYLFCSIRPWIGKTKPDGTAISSCFDAAEYLLEDALIAAVPGGAFGAGGNIRFSFACSEKDIERGVPRIAEAIRKLK